MDWSLVLVSQGIETAIAAPEKTEGWRLLVPSRDYELAMQTIRQYRLENRGWPWQQKGFRPGMIFDWGSLAWMLLIFLFFWINNRHDLDPSGLMDSTAVARGEWWRLLTANWLHADLAHLPSNA